MLFRSEVRALCTDALAHLDHALATNRREDGLYHAYNVLVPSRADGAMGLHRLDEMLEGQVAVLSSGAIAPAEAVAMLDALFASALHRADQHSFVLYPDKALPSFLERNRIPEARVAAVPLFGDLIAAGDATVVVRDAASGVRFSERFQNARDLEAALDRLAAQPRWAATVARDRQGARDAFEAVFHHHSFTGRSGRMYGYEGLGSIYWHMVAKLLLAVQEILTRARDTQAPTEVVAALEAHYRRVRAGLGFEKTATEYGAFPFDPYSHTPKSAGAQQPGMTGQVKEEILTRMVEVGVRFRDGGVNFDPVTLSRRERLAAASVMRVLGFDGAWRDVSIPAGGYGFTLAQVPVVVTVAERAGLTVHRADGSRVEVAGLTLEPALTQQWMARQGEVVQVDVRLPEQAFGER